MSLTIEHVTAYFPHDVKVAYDADNDEGEEFGSILGLRTIEETLVMIKGVRQYHHLELCRFTLILRPMSEVLTYFENCEYYQSFKNELESHNCLLECSYQTIKTLLKHKFDVYDLISQGLAVSCHDVGVSYG